MRHGRNTALAAALVLLLPGTPSRADEGDVSFITALGGGAMLLLGTAMCAASDQEGEGYARDGLYFGAGATYAFDNFQQKGGGGAGAWRRFVSKRDGTTNQVGTDVVGPCAPGSRTADRRSCGTTGAMSSALNRANVLLPAQGVRLEDGDSFGVNGRLGFRCHPRAALEAHFEYLLDDFNATFDTTGEFINPFIVGNVKNVDRMRRVRSNIELWTLGANSKVFLMTGRVQPYVMGGLGIMRVKETSSRVLVARESRTRNPFTGAIVSRVIDCTDPNSVFAGDSCFNPANPSGSPVDTDQFKDIDLAVRMGGGIDLYATENWVLGIEGAYVRATGRAEPYDFVSVMAGIQYRFGGGKKRED